MLNDIFAKWGLVISRKHFPAGLFLLETFSLCPSVPKCDFNVFNIRTGSRWDIFNRIITRGLSCIVILQKLGVLRLEFILSPH